MKLTLNQSKYEFSIKTIKYLGSIVTAGKGIFYKLDKLKVIKE